MLCTHGGLLILTSEANYIMPTFLSSNYRKQAHTTHKRKTLRSNQRIMRQTFLEKICDEIFSKEYTNTDI